MGRYGDWSSASDSASASDASLLAGSSVPAVVLAGVEQDGDAGEALAAREARPREALSCARRVERHRSRTGVAGIARRRDPAPRRATALQEVARDGLAVDRQVERAAHPG